MPETRKKSKAIPVDTVDSKALSSQWKAQLVGEWTEQEMARIMGIFQSLAEQTGGKPVSEHFNGQPTILHHSGRPGRAGRTRGADIFLDEDWTDWTLAHELGHRWNNAWDRQPEAHLQKMVGAGKLEWLKKGNRQFAKWFEKFLRRLGVKARLDWRALWYHPGNAPPPCGVDRNFNASEDLAECFAATILQEEVKARAQRAAQRLGGFAENWNWTSKFPNFSATPRGQTVMMLLKELSSQQENSQQTD